MRVVTSLAHDISRYAGSVIGIFKTVYLQEDDCEVIAGSSLLFSPVLFSCLLHSYGQTAFGIWSLVHPPINISDLFLLLCVPADIPCTGSSFNRLICCIY